MKDLIQQILPALSAKLQEHDISIDSVTFQWFFMLFVKSVPTDCSLTIWDSLLLEGRRVLFRYALAILKCVLHWFPGFEGPADSFFSFSYVATPHRRDNRRVDAAAARACAIVLTAAAAAALQVPRGCHPEAAVARRPI